jgi:hypothetical protein
MKTWEKWVIGIAILLVFSTIGYEVGKKKGWWKKIKSEIDKKKSSHSIEEFVFHADGDVVDPNGYYQGSDGNVYNNLHQQCDGTGTLILDYAGNPIIDPDYIDNSTPDSGATMSDLGDDGSGIDDSSNPFGGGSGDSGSGGGDSGGGSGDSGSGGGDSGGGSPSPYPNPYTQPIVPIIAAPPVAVGTIPTIPVGHNSATAMRAGMSTTINSNPGFLGGGTTPLPPGGGQMGGSPPSLPTLSRRPPSRSAIRGFSAARGGSRRM